MEKFSHLNNVIILDCITSGVHVRGLRMNKNRSS